MVLLTENVHRCSTCRSQVVLPRVADIHKPKTSVAACPMSLDPQLHTATLTRSLRETISQDHTYKAAPELELVVTLLRVLLPWHEVVIEAVGIQLLGSPGCEPDWFMEGALPQNPVL